MGSLLGGVTTALTPQNQFNAQAPAVIGQQQQLAQALAAQAAGTGPNPAQAQFQQNVNQAIQQTSGQIASQKGINPALAARLGSQNAAAMTQGAAGQEAVVQAQQQLGAQGQEAQVLGTIGQEQLAPQAINAAGSAQNAAANQKTAGGILSGVGAALGFADGGTVDASSQIADQISQMAGLTKFAAGNTGSDSSKLGSGITKLAGSIGGGSSPMSIAGGPMDSLGGAGGAADLAVMAAAHGGEIPQHLKDVAEIYHGKKFESPKVTQLKASGGPVPGKAKVSGDSQKNDTVKTLLSPGEVVIPRSIMNSKDPVKGAANFVAEQLRKHGKGESKGSPEEFKSALKNAISSRKMAS